MNSEDRRQQWDLKYQHGLPSLTKPDPFFVLAYESFVGPRFPTAGVALDLAGGLGGMPYGLLAGIGRLPW
jgi:hypothetical protein